MAKIFGRVERVGAWVTALAVIAAAITSALGNTGLAGRVAFAVGVVYLPFGVGAALLEFETLSGTPWQRLRRAVVLCVLAVSIAVTAWPLRLSFTCCRGSLERLASQARSGQTPTVPVRAGLFTIRKIEMRGNVVCLWTEPNSAGPKCFANCASEEVEGRFNLWSTDALADDWQWIVED